MRTDSMGGLGQSWKKRYDAMSTNGTRNLGDEASDEEVSGDAEVNSRDAMTRAATSPQN